MSSKKNIIVSWLYGSQFISLITKYDKYHASDAKSLLLELQIISRQLDSFSVQKYAKNFSYVEIELDLTTKLLNKRSKLMTNSTEILTKFMVVQRNSLKKYNHKSWHHVPIDKLLEETMYVKVKIIYRSYNNDSSQNIEKSFQKIVMVKGYQNMLDFKENFALRVNDLLEYNDLKKLSTKKMKG